MTRYRVRLSFTVWRLMAAMACFCLVLGMIHDAEHTKKDEMGWSLVVAAVIFYLFLGALIVVPLCKLVYARVRYLTALHRPGEQSGAKDAGLL